MDSDPPDTGSSAGKSSDAFEFHRSSNGDRWFLCRYERRSPIVRHVPNAASGGAVSELAVCAFLSPDRRGPEHDALIDLLSGLIPFASGSAQPDSGIAASRPGAERFAQPRAQVGADTLLLAVTRVCTFAQERQLT